MSDVAIRMLELSKSFGAVNAVAQLSLEVPAGIVFGFLGPNGAGKTTTIRLLLGLLEPTQGQAEVLGYDPRRQAQEIRARTGALLERDGLYGQMSAEHNLEYQGRIYRLGAAERQARIQQLLTHLGLWDRRRERVETWSKGMRQKLALARAMLHRPQLVFLDEPTAGLDVMAAAAVREDLAALSAREGATVFLTTHNMAEAERLCSRVAVIRGGRLLAVGHPDELRRRAGGLRVEVLGRGLDEGLARLLRQRPEVAAAHAANGWLLVDLREGAESAPLINALVGAGAQVEEVRRGQASLEDVFVTLMEEEKR